MVKKSYMDVFVAAMCILCFASTTISVIFRTTIGALIFFGLFIIVRLIFNKNKEFKIKFNRTTMFGCFGVFFIIIFEYLLDRGVGQSSILFLIVYFIMISTIVQSLSYDKEKYNLFLKIIFFVLIINWLVSIFYLLTNASVVKEITGNATTENKDYVIAKLCGVGGSIYYQSLAIIYPFLLGAILDKKLTNSKFINISTIIIIPFLILLSQSVTALTIFALGFGMFFIQMFFSNASAKSKGAFVFAIIIVFSLISLSNISKNETIKDLLDRVDSVTENFTEENKIDDISYKEREILNEISKKTFLKYPFFGYGTSVGKLKTRVVGGYGNGGHSSFYDTLAMYGIFGSVFWVLMYRGVIGKLSLFNNKSLIKKGKLSMLVIFCFSLFTNPILASFETFCFLALMNGVNNCQDNQII